MTAPGPVLTIPLLTLALCTAIQGARLIPQDLLFTRWETEVGFWGRGSYHPTGATREHTAQGIETLLRSAPENPQYLTLQASQQAWEAYWSEDDETQAHHSANAMAAQQEAQQQRPAHRQGWQLLSQYAASTDPSIAEQAVNQLTTLAPDP